MTTVKSRQCSNTIDVIEELGQEKQPDTERLAELRVKTEQNCTWSCTQYGKQDKPR